MLMPPTETVLSSDLLGRLRELYKSSGDVPQLVQVAPVPLWRSNDVRYDSIIMRGWFKE